MNKLEYQITKKIILCFLFLQFLFTVNAQLPTTGLVGYYPFNNNTNDESNLLAHGINYGASLTNDRFGQANSAYQFNGIDQYIEVPDNDQFSISNTGRLSVSVWMRSDVLDFPQDENNYIHWMGKGVSNQQEWHLRMYNLDDIERPNRTSCYVFNLAGGLGSGSYVQESVAVGEWIHIVAVYDFPNNTIKLYKNGILKDTDFFTDYNVIPENGTAPLRFGTRDFNSYYQGAIDDVRFYNRVLTDLEITELYSEINPILSIESAISIKYEPIVIYPNPTYSELTLKTEQTSFLDNDRVKIFSQIGVELYSTSIRSQQTKIDLSDFSQGTYILTTSINGITKAYKFLKD